MITIAIVLAALLGLAFVLLASRRSNNVVRPEDVENLTTAIDLEAFRNLVSAADDRFLRQHLSRQDYRRVYRARQRAILAYLKTTARNAAVLMRLAEGARKHADAAVAASATELGNNAAIMRLYALSGMVRIYASLWIPGAELSVAATIDRYQTLRNKVTQLVSLSSPSYTSQVSRAL